MKSVHTVFCSLIIIMLYKHSFSKPILNHSENGLIDDDVTLSSRLNEEGPPHSKNNKRSKRGYFYGYDYKGPLSPNFDSNEYESDTPPSTFNVDEVGYADLNSGPDVFLQSKDAIEVFLTTSIPDTPDSNADQNDDSYQPSYSYEPPIVQEDVKKEPSVASTTEKSAPEPNHLPPSTSYGVPISTLTVVEEDIVPNKELISIADKHIKELDDGKAKAEKAIENHVITPKNNHEKSAKKEVSILTSYGVPLSSVTGYPPFEIATDKTVNKKLIGGPPATSYGVPDHKVTGYPRYVIAGDSSTDDIDFKNTDTKTKVKGPPATSYGVPDKVYTAAKSLNLTTSTKSYHSKKEDAKPYDLLNSSYGAPLKSVTTLANVTSLESLGIPDPNIKTKFDATDENSNEASKDSDSDNAASSKQFVRISMDDYKMISVCMEKSFNSAFSLKKDGSLVRE